MQSLCVTEINVPRIWLLWRRPGLGVTTLLCKEKLQVKRVRCNGHLTELQGNERLRFDSGKHSITYFNLLMGPYWVRSQTLEPFKGFLHLLTTCLLQRDGYFNPLTKPNNIHILCSQDQCTEHGKYVKFIACQLNCKWKTGWWKKNKTSTKKS